MQRTFFDGLCSHKQKKVLFFFCFFLHWLYLKLLYAFMESNLYVS